MEICDDQSTVCGWIEALPPAPIIRRELEKNSAEARLLRDILALAQRRDKMRERKQTELVTVEQ